MAWERWQALPPDKQEEYKRRARGYAGRGRRAFDRRRGALERHRRGRRG